jgi:hypothetical protein
MRGHSGALPMEATAIATAVPGRTCGSCAMCCKLHHIPELEKPVGVWCRHVVRGRGCGIYDDRPASCRSFFCLWMLDPALGPEWKPERAKFVLHMQGNGVHLQVAVDRGFPNAWMKEPYFGALRRWAREGADRGRFVFVRTGPRLVAMLPGEERDLGEVGQDDDIVVSRRMTPAGYAYDVTIGRRPAP